MGSTEQEAPCHLYYGAGRLAAFQFICFIELGSPGACSD